MGHGQCFQGDVDFVEQRAGGLFTPELCLHPHTTRLLLCTQRGKLLPNVMHEITQGNQHQGEVLLGLCYYVWDLGFAGIFLKSAFFL